MEPPPATRLRVAVCGGGISGLCLAVALSRYPDIQVRLFEASDGFTEVGAGVMIWARTWNILRSMGVEEEFSKVAHSPPDGSLGVGFDYRRSDTPTEGFSFERFELPYGCIRFHRAHFLDAFIRHLPSGVARFQKRLSAYSHVTPSGLSLQFDDGDETVCDLLVGCDGIKSTVRAQIFQDLARNEQPELADFIEPVWSGTIAYRGLIPVEKLGNHRTIDTPMMYCGKSKHIVSYSISQGTVVNVVAFNASDASKEGTSYDGPWVTPCTKQELLDCYENWEPEVEELLNCVENPTKWALHITKPLPTFISTDVVLIGDAAHAMLPHQGAGAGVAIEDAFIFASLLGDPSVTPSSLSLALEAYEHIRQPLAHHVQTGSRVSGQMYEFDSAFGEDYEALGPAIERQWGWLWEGSAEEDVRRGLEWMRAGRDGGMQLT